MRWLLNFIFALLPSRRGSSRRHHLMGMYFNESNRAGMRKSNRERA
jgi:hypothetical protein